MKKFWISLKLQAPTYPKKSVYYVNEPLKQQELENRLEVYVQKKRTCETQNDRCFFFLPIQNIAILFYK